jgi:hypothetical protein
MMTVGQLKKRLANYPDDMEVIIESTDWPSSRQLRSTSDEQTTVTRYCTTTSHNNDPDATGQMRRCHRPGCPTAKDAFRVA